MDGGYFKFPFSQGFQSPQTALVQKDRFWEENPDAVNPQYDEFFNNTADFVFSSDKSEGPFDEIESLIAKSKLCYEFEGAASISTSSPQATRVKLDNSTGTLSEQSKIFRSSHSIQKRKPGGSERYAFMIRSDSEVLEDGYKWRKYGKKFIKGNPNPRNYYRCSCSTCGVRKRVQRDAEDKGIVITTYEGKHNHESSTTVYYITNPPTFQPELASPLKSYAPPASHRSHSPTDFMLSNRT